MGYELVLGSHLLPFLHHMKQQQPLPQKVITSVTDTTTSERLPGFSSILSSLRSSLGLHSPSVAEPSATRSQPTVPVSSDSTSLTLVLLTTTLVQDHSSLAFLESAISVSHASQALQLNSIASLKSSLLGSQASHSQELSQFSSRQSSINSEISSALSHTQASPSSVSAILTSLGPQLSSVASLKSSISADLTSKASQISSNASLESPASASLTLEATPLSAPSSIESIRSSIQSEASRISQ